MSEPFLALSSPGLINNLVQQLLLDQSASADSIASPALKYKDLAQQVDAFVDQASFNSELSALSDSTADLKVAGANPFPGQISEATPQPLSEQAGFMETMTVKFTKTAYLTFEALSAAIPAGDKGTDQGSDISAELGIPDQVPPPGLDTPEELDAAIKDWEEMLNSIGDDAQLANIDLQNVLQKQQQTMQLMSNASKMIHDVDMAAIRKLG
jgi:hypothetical protein